LTWNPSHIGFVIAALVVVAPSARADCLDDAADYFSLDPVLVHAIAKHESGMHANAISYDLGLMQINTSWLPVLATKGISAQQLMNGCVNGYVGAWILRSNIERFGYTWKAVGAYNASSVDKQLRYANNIYEIWQSLKNGASNQLASH
jgi:soluble lytic murein transglycosylase-like protein